MNDNIHLSDTGYSFAALSFSNTISAKENARLFRTLQEIKHSIGQARILGNDWKRELALIDDLVNDALKEEASNGKD